MWVTRDEALLLTGALSNVVDHGGTDVTVDLCQRVLTAWKIAGLEEQEQERSVEDEMYEDLQRRFDRLLAVNTGLSRRLAALEWAVVQHRATAGDEHRKPLPCDLLLWAAVDA